MKKILFILLLLPAFYGFSQGSLAALDAKNGYKDIKLGQQISTLGENNLKYIKGDTKPDAYESVYYYYLNPAATTIGGDIKIDRIILEAYQGKIASISLIFKPEEGEKLKNVFTEAYGKPSQSEQDVNKYFWFATEVSLFIDYEKDGNPIAVLYSQSIKKSIEQHKQSSTAKAAADL